MAFYWLMSTITFTQSALFRTPWRARLGLVAPALVVLVFYAGLVGYIAGNYFEGDAACFARVGETVATQHLIANKRCIMRESAGYDGQFFYFIALDPTLTTYDPRASLDQPSYRYGRILYPTLAWLAALGRAELVPWALVLVNVVAAAAATLGAAYLLTGIRVIPWLSLVVGLSPPVIIGTLADLSEPVAMACLVWGVALHFRSRHALAAVALTCATLTREVGVIVPVIYASVLAAQGKWRSLAPYLLAPSALVLWNLVLWFRFDAFGIINGSRNFGPPLGGMIYRMRWLLGMESPVFGEGLATSSQLNGELPILILSLAVIALGLTKPFTRPSTTAIQLAAQCFLMIFLTADNFLDIFSFGRTLGPMYLFYGLAMLEPRRATRLLRQPQFAPP
ncbi:MAG: hypothetical protein U0821_26635 [Chloroflexota bacterium]